MANSVAVIFEDKKTGKEFTEYVKEEDLNSFLDSLAQKGHTLLFIEAEDGDGGYNNTQETSYSQTVQVSYNESDSEVIDFVATFCNFRQQRFD